MKRALIISIWILLVVGLISVLGYAYTAHQAMTCEKVDILINYDNADCFLTITDVNDFLALKKIKIKGAALSDINSGDIETALYANPYIQLVDVYTTIEGSVKITITQRKPIVKVYNKFNQSFYVDDKGRLMPPSENYTARLLVANGNITDMYNPATKLDVSDSTSADTIVMAKAIYKVFRLTQFIIKDEFWKAMVEEIYVNSDGDLEFFTKIGDQTIIFGDIDNMKEKFDRLLVFYKKGLNKIGWSKYKSINLKYKDQVVCSKI